MNPLDIALQEAATANAQLLARVFNLAIENAALKAELEAAKAKPPKVTGT